MSRHKFPKCILNVVVNGYADVTDGYQGWNERGDGVRWRQLRFEGKPNAPHVVVTIYALSDGSVEIDAPGLFLAESSTQGEYRTIVLSVGPNPRSGTPSDPI